jgi:hypothetical protein
MSTTITTMAALIMGIMVRLMRAKEAMHQPPLG